MEVVDSPLFLKSNKVQIENLRSLIAIIFLLYLEILERLYKVQNVTLFGSEGHPDTLEHKKRTFAKVLQVYE